MKNYCIKNGYKSYHESFAIDKSRKELYWNKYRIRSSSAFQWSVYQYASALIKKWKLKTIVDLGCGSGIKLNKLIAKSATNIIGVDQKSAIEYCKKNHKQGRYYVDDFDNPSLELNENIDFIICADVIEHLVDPDVLLDYLKQISNNDTYILFSTPERDLLRGQDCMESTKPEHVREWNSMEFKCYLENSGFSILDHKLEYPLRFTLNNSFLYFTILCRQLKNNLSFKWTQVVLCRKRESGNELHIKKN